MCRLRGAGLRWRPLHKVLKHQPSRQARLKSVGEDIILPKTNEYPRADGIRPYMEKC